MAALQPSGVVPAAGSIGIKFISDLSILKPQAYDKFIDKYGNQDYTMIMEMIGKKAMVPSRDFFHFESRGKLHQSIQATGATVTAASAGAETGNITLATGSHTNSGTESPLRVGEVVEITASGVQAKITAISKTT